MDSPEREPFSDDSDSPLKPELLETLTTPTDISDIDKLRFSYSKLSLSALGPGNESHTKIDEETVYSEAEYLSGFEAEAEETKVLIRSKESFSQSLKDTNKENRTGSRRSDNVLDQPFDLVKSLDNFSDYLDLYVRKSEPRSPSFKQEFQELKQAIDEVGWDLRPYSLDLSQSQDFEDAFPDDEMQIPKNFETFAKTRLKNLGKVDGSKKFVSKLPQDGRKISDLTEETSKLKNDLEAQKRYGIRRQSSKSESSCTRSEMSFYLHGQRNNLGEAEDLEDKRAFLKEVLQKLNSQPQKKRKSSLECLDNVYKYLSAPNEYLQTTSCEFSEVFDSEFAKILKEANRKGHSPKYDIFKTAQDDHTCKQVEQIATENKKDKDLNEMERKLKNSIEQMELFKMQAAVYEQDFREERKRANDLKSKFDEEKEKMAAKISELETKLQAMNEENRTLKLKTSKLAENDGINEALHQRKARYLEKREKLWKDGTFRGLNRVNSRPENANRRVSAPRRNAICATISTKNEQCHQSFSRTCSSQRPANLHQADQHERSFLAQFGNFFHYKSGRETL